VDIETFPAADLDLPLADALVAVTAAAKEHVDTAHVSGRELVLEIAHTDEAYDAIWVARERGEVVGWAASIEPIHEYADTTFVRGAVHPLHQRRGHGRALLGEVVGRSRRDKLRARAWRGTAGSRALPRLGFQRTLTNGVRRLSLADPGPRWAALRAEAEDASSDYELVARTGPTPEGELAEMVVLREAINDAPDANEWEAHPPERIAAYERDLVARRQTQHTIVARHRETGEPAGITMVCVHELAPRIAAQEDTSVLRAHRGHRLGLRLKIAMADWLRDARPDVQAVDTWNDTTNAPMLAINERLGTALVAESSVYRRSR
jgi:GNAT superfamily N-acetyltransferase